MKLSEFFKTHEWCRGCHAKDKYGNPIPVLSDQAHSFCLIGACWRINNEIGWKSTDTYKEYKTKIIEKAKELYGYRHIFALSQLNDRYIQNKEQLITILEEVGL